MSVKKKILKENIFLNKKNFHLYLLIILFFSRMKKFRHESFFHLFHIF